MMTHKSSSYFIYIVLCQDGSYYTGIAADVVRRLAEHISQSPECAKYTRSHPVVALAALWTAPDRALASKLEYRIKHLSRKKKEALVANPDLVQELVLPDGENPYTPQLQLSKIWEEAQLVSTC